MNTIKIKNTATNEILTFEIFNSFVFCKERLQKYSKDLFNKNVKSGKFIYIID